jgi:D-alanine-D-alanine ligase
MQGALELIGMPYTGSGVMASALGMDKWRTKLVWRAAGLPDRRLGNALLTAECDFDAVEKQLGLPLFVKPANEGSSVGISKVREHGGLRAAYEEAAKHDPLVLAEKFMPGGEFTVAILGDTALPVVKIEPATDFYDYEAKYLRDDTEYHCPAGLADTQEMALRQLALEAFRLIDGRGWGRVDLMLDSIGNPYLLEVNTAPGMTDHSLVPMAARAAGLDFDALCLAILEQTLA